MKSEYLLLNAVQQNCVQNAALHPTTQLVDINPKIYRDINLLGRTCFIEIDQRRYESVIPHHLSE